MKNIGGRDRDAVVAVDLGGTKILTAVFDADFAIIGRKKVKTRAYEGADAIFEGVVDSITAAIASSGLSVDAIRGIGIVIPGVFDRSTGFVVETPNLPLSAFPLKSRLSKRFSVPIFIENDVNAGTYGEFRSGAATGYRHVVGVFPGTGIGGGLILDGKLFIGATGNAGEIGHMIIHSEGPLCGCGQRGCLEALASRSAMARDAVYLASSGSAPAALEQAGTDYSRYSSKTFSKALAAGDDAIAGVVDRAAWNLGIGLANCANLLSPEIIVIGGGLVERLGRTYVESVSRSMRAHAMSGIGESVEIVEAKLGDDAAILGSAALTRDATDG